MSDHIDIRRATLSEIIDLRHQVLRAGLPRETAIFPGDELPTSRHYGAFALRDGEMQAVGCVTLHLNSWDDAPAWQLRGMATADNYRRRGLGRALVEIAERELLADASSLRVLWCNARVPAVGFYQLMGWRIVSEEFEIATAGPHVRMLRQI